MEISLTMVPTWWPWLLAGSIMGFVVFFKIIRLFRPPKLVKVNCCFCNGNTRVPYGNQNCFNCPHCDQYNGFDEFGDYNKPIPAQYHEEFNHYSNAGHNSKNRTAPSGPSSEGVLCRECNINQTLKVQQLAAFVPYNENNFDVEVEHFKSYLENLYPLCELCEENVYQVLCDQDQLLKTKLIGKWLQQSRPSSPMALLSASHHPVPFTIHVLRLISVLSAIVCLTIDFHHRDVIDVKGRLHQYMTDIPAIGQHRSSFVLTGLLCVIAVALIAGKKRLRYIDAVSPFVWLLNFTINWTPHIPQFIAQLPWIQKLYWLPWQLCWHLGVSICCLVCSLVFVFSNREVVKKRKFKRSDSSSGNLRSASSCDTSARSSVVSDEPPYQPHCNDVSMVSDHMTPPTNHDRHGLGDSLNTLSLGPPAEQKTKTKSDIWTNYTNPNSSKSSSGYASKVPSNSDLTTGSPASSSSKMLILLGGLSSLCIIVFRCLVVLAAVSCLLVDLHRNQVLDVRKQMAKFAPDFPPVGRHRPEIALFGLLCAIMATFIAWRKRFSHIGTIGIILWSLTLDWSLPWLPTVHVQSPWLQYIYNWLPWKLCWKLSIPVCCVLYSGMLLVFNIGDLTGQTLSESEIIPDSYGTSDDNASTASTSGSSEVSQHHYGNNVTMVSDDASSPQANNYDRPVLVDCINTMSLGQQGEKRRTARDIWTPYNNPATISSPRQIGSSIHQRRPIIQPAKLQFTPRSKVNMGQQGFMSSGKDHTKFSTWHNR